jgi:hypothetical protein
MNFKSLIQNENFQLSVILVLFTIAALLCGCFMFGCSSPPSSSINNEEIKPNLELIPSENENINSNSNSNSNYDEDLVPDNMSSSSFINEDDVNLVQDKQQIQDNVNTNEVIAFDYKLKHSLEGTPIGDYMSLDPNNKNPIVTDNSPYIKNQKTVSSDVPITGPMFNLNNTIQDEDILRIGGISIEPCNTGESYYYLDDKLIA